MAQGTQQEGRKNLIFSIGFHPTLASDMAKAQVQTSDSFSAFVRKACRHYVAFLLSAEIVEFDPVDPDVLVDLEMRDKAVEQMIAEELKATGR